MATLIGRKRERAQSFPWWPAQDTTFLTITAQTYRHKHKLLCRGGWAVRTCHDYTLQHATNIRFYCAIHSGIHVTYCITRNSLWPKNLDDNKNMRVLVKTWFLLHKKHFVIKMWSSFFFTHYMNKYAVWDRSFDFNNSMFSMSKCDDFTVFNNPVTFLLYLLHNISCYVELNRLHADFKRAMRDLFLYRFKKKLSKNKRK